MLIFIEYFIFIYLFSWKQEKYKIYIYLEMFVCLFILPMG